MTEKYPGLYRGTVGPIPDPMQLGRVQVVVPDVTGPGVSTWAKPCFPTGGLAQGFFSVPMAGAGVYVMYEQGDPDYPVWMGTFLGSLADKPLLANTVPPPTPGITIQTPLKNGIVISDGLGPTGVGGITIQSATGAMIAVNDTGIIIRNSAGAQISLLGNAVDVNFGALTVL